MTEAVSGTRGNRPSTLICDQIGTGIENCTGGGEEDNGKLAREGRRGEKASRGLHATGWESELTE